MFDECYIVDFLHSYSDTYTIINDSEKTLPKMTLVWTILAVFLGYVWGK